MNALREAKAEIGLAERLRAVARNFGMAYDDLDAIEEAAALVEAVEAAPVVSLWLGDADDQFVVDSPEEAQAIIDAGHRVRVLAVGEDG